MSSVIVLFLVGIAIVNFGIAMLQTYMLDNASNMGALQVSILVCNYLSVLILCWRHRLAIRTDTVLVRCLVAWTVLIFGLCLLTLDLTVSASGFPIPMDVLVSGIVLMTPMPLYFVFIAFKATRLAVLSFILLSFQIIGLSVSYSLFYNFFETVSISCCAVNTGLIILGYTGTVVNENGPHFDYFQKEPRVEPSLSKSPAYTMTIC